MGKRSRQDILYSERRLDNEVKKLSEKIRELEERNTNKTLTICGLLAFYFYPILIYWMEIFTTKDVVAHYIIGICFFSIVLLFCLLWSLYKNFSTKPKK
ncbi:MAG: hypothetical protein L3J07_00040 [Candidatus Magasanikbacteria bacterium]|nr:hypothetical protein [Candidatus Magasanikbacteria bacterium]